MKTLILQSYRTGNVPAWVSQCLASVHDWAIQTGHAYLRIGDELFDGLEPRIVARAAGAKVAQTDLGRALWIRDLLRTWERVAWIDADIYIFDRDGFQLYDADPFAMCFECWPYRSTQGIVFKNQVNNGVFTFTRDQHFLEDYINLASQILTSADPVRPHSVGTPLFSTMYVAAPFPLRRDVIMFNHLLLDELLAGGGALLRVVRKRHGGPINAVHMVHSFTQAGSIESVSDARMSEGLTLMIERWEGAKAYREGSPPATRSTAA